MANISAPGLSAKRPPHMSCPRPDSAGAASGAGGGGEADAVMSSTSLQPAPAANKSLAARAAAILAALGLVVVLYWLFAAGAKREEGGYRAFATGALAGLEVLPNPPPQPATPLARPGAPAATLADFRGKVVLVNLWATWCAPCVEELPSLAALQRAYPGADFQVLPVSVDPMAHADKAAARLGELGGGALPFLHDPTYAVAYDAKARGFPTTILYGRDGRELARLSRGANWASPEAKSLIDAALAETPL